ncbi:eukaryotic translation initiation factor 3 subunit M [Euwallacea similis]|uniref:eukaryotic translation initiation factor 3 subunit M n=1 Tax=Euwallacea similis TaxID=1736056 RepID=UPI00344D29DF
MQVPPVFIDIALEDQTQELRGYLKSLGAEISEERSPKGIEDDLHKIIGVCDTCFKEGNEPEVELVLNDIVSIMVLVSPERAENIILAFCEKLTKAQGQKLGEVCLKALWLLYQSLDEKSPMRYPVYYHLLLIAKQTDQIKAIFLDVARLKQEFSQCPPSNEDLQKLYRLLHEVLLKGNQSEQAAKVMIELLGTYTDKTASHARDDAIRCITTAIADPKTFLLDPLLSLKPVHILKGQLIHDLLNIFVSENLAAYLKFYQEHKEFVTNQGLNHEQNMRKMRLLSFMQLAEATPELSFEAVEQELQIKRDEVEAFIIEVLKTKLVCARMDQSAKKVYVSSTMHRTFGRTQWQQLRDLLQSWKNNLSVVQDGMRSVTAEQL